VSEVVLNNLSKFFGKTCVTKDMNLTINSGEFLVLVGPSGCGKSTILRMIAGLESITSGSIDIDKTCVNDIPSKDRDIAMVFQSYALYPHMSVYDNMAFGLKMRKTPVTEIQKQVHETAKILDLMSLLDRKPKELSGGQRQRVALGRAIVRAPKVFLMDEPLSNLDAKLRVHMRAEIQKLHQRLKVTTIYVTHDQIEAMTMGQRIVVLHDGKIQQVGTPSEVYDTPKNTFVGGFIGSMMFLEPKVKDNQLVFNSGLTWNIPEQKVALIHQQQLNGKKIILGIRPEHFSEHLESNETQKLTLTPEIVETLGPEKWVHFKFEGQSNDKDNMLAAIPTDLEASSGTPMDLSLDLNKASYFHPDNKENLVLLGQPITASTPC